MLEKVMPHNIEAEQSVLGSMFLNKYAAQKSVENLNADVFYLDSHAKIFDVLSTFVEKNIPIDLTTVTAELDQRKILKQIGDVEYLTEIINTVPTASNIDEYIKIVEHCAIKRRLIKESSEIVEAVYQSTDELADLLDNAERS